MSISKIGPIVVGIIVGVGAMFFLRDDGGGGGNGGEQKIALTTTTSTKGEVTMYLETSGVLESASSININAPRARYERKLIEVVPEGTIVHAGDQLARFDVAEVETDLERLRDAGHTDLYKDTELSSNISIDERRANFESAEENLKIAQLTYDGMKYAPEMEQQKALIRLNQAKAEVKINETRIRQEEQRRDVKLRQIQAKIDENDIRIAEVEQTLKDYTITSPSDGIVVYPKIRISGTRRKVQLDDNLYTDQLFLTIPNLFKMTAEVEVDEKDIRKIAVGQSAIVSLEAYQDAEFSGTVESIQRLAQIKSNNPYIKFFEVIITIKESDVERLRPGMNTRTKIQTAHYEDIVHVPIEFVMRKGSDSFLYVLKDDEIEETPITVSDSNAMTAALADFPDGEIVIRPDAELRRFLALPNPDTSKVSFLESDAAIP